jgi:hypothetical protein
MSPDHSKIFTSLASIEHKQFPKAMSPSARTFTEQVNSVDQPLLEDNAKSMRRAKFFRKRHNFRAGI